MKTLEQIRASEAESVRAGYEVLAPEQRQQFDALMVTKPGKWPVSLREYVDDFIKRNGKCGETIAEAIGYWVKAQGD